MKNKNIGNKILFMIIFVSLFVVGFVLLSYLMRPVTTSRKNICGFYAEKDNSIEVMFVGGSDCYTSWQPLRAWNEYGFTSFNFATDALQPQVIKYMLEEILKTQSPELFVIDLRPFQYGDLVSQQEKNLRNIERVAPFRNFSDNIKYSENRFQVINKCAPVQEEKWTYYFDIAKYHNGLYAFLNAENWMYLFNEKRLYNKGFFCYEESNAIEFMDTRGITDEKVLDKEMNTLFLDLLDYCYENDLNVLFLVYPYCNNDVDKMKYNYMESQIKQYNFDYLNLNNYFFEMQLDVLKDFHDVDHVSLLGADKVSKFLSAYLIEHYNLADRRDIPEYMQWNEDYEKWNSEMELIRINMINKN